MKVLVFHIVKDNQQYSFYVKNAKNITKLTCKRIVDQVSETFNFNYGYENIDYIQSMTYSCDMSVNKIDGDIEFRDCGSYNFTPKNNTIEVK